MAEEKLWKIPACLGEQQGSFGLELTKICKKHHSNGRCLSRRKMQNISGIALLASLSNFCSYGDQQACDQGIKGKSKPLNEASQQHKGDWRFGMCPASPSTMSSPPPFSFVFQIGLEAETSVKNINITNSRTLRKRHSSLNLPQQDPLLAGLSHFFRRISGVGKIFRPKNTFLRVGG